MKMVSCKVLTIANDNEKYKTHMFVIVFIHYFPFFVFCALMHCDGVDISRINIHITTQFSFIFFHRKIYLFLFYNCAR